MDLVNTNASQSDRPSVSQPVVLHMPVDVRSVSMVTLSLLGVVYTLHWAAPVFIPILVSLMLTYALSPTVSFLERRLRVSRWISSALLILALVCATGGAAYKLYGSAVALTETLPVAAAKLRASIYNHGRTAIQPSALDSVQKAAAQLEQTAERSAPSAGVKNGVMRVTVERSPFNIRDYLWNGTMGLVAAAGQLTLIAFLTFFTLGSGDLFRRKLVRLAGARFEKKKITLHVLNDITAYIERYLVAQVLTSVLVGILTGIAFALLGLENAVMWGVTAAITNLIPYVGSLAVMAVAGTAAFLQFEALQPAFSVMGASLLIHTLVGNLLLPWLTGRSCRMNPVAVFVGVIFWGWLWGLWGLLLGMPIMMMIKAVCEHVEDLQPIGELLSD